MDQFTLETFRNDFYGRSAISKLTEAQRAIILNQYHKDCQTIISQAEAVCENSFLFIGKWNMERTIKAHTFQDKIIWDFTPNGDLEWTFVLNRHDFLIELGQGYYLTKNKKYLKAFERLMNDWIDNNPLNEITVHSAWRSIEAGIRCLNWAKALSYVIFDINDETLRKMMEALKLHADYIIQNQRDLSLVTNWSIIEFSGLYVCANQFAFTEACAHWRDLSLQKVLAAVSVQLYSDGMHREQSSTYHQEVLQCLKQMVLSDRLCGISSDQKLKDMMFEMANATIKVLKPDGHQPLKGDSDDIGVDDLLVELAMLLKKPELAFRSIPKTFDMMLTYPEGDMDDLTQQLRPEPDYASVALSKSHYYVMRDGWSKDSNYLMFFAGNMGGGHGHIDLLHVDLYKHGKNILCDPGRFTYREQAPERFYFKAGSAHNTLEVDDIPMTEYVNTWGYDFVAAPMHQHFETNDIYDYVEASHDGYMRLASPVLHTRKILYVKGWGHIIMDALKGDGPHKITRFFNFATHAVIETSQGVQTNFGSHDVRMDLNEGASFSLMDAYHSEHYNHKVATKRCVVTDEIMNQQTLFAVFTSIEDEISVSFEAVCDMDGHVLPSNEAVAIKLNKNHETMIVTHVMHQHNQTNLYQLGDTVVLGDHVLIHRGDHGKTITNYR